MLKKCYTNADLALAAIFNRLAKYGGMEKSQALKRLDKISHFREKYFHIADIRFRFNTF